VGVNATRGRSRSDPLDDGRAAMSAGIVMRADVSTLAYVLIASVERFVFKDVLKWLPHLEGLDVSIQQLPLDEVKLLDDPLEVIVNHDLHGYSFIIAAVVHRSLAVVSTLH
jgi:hypothetical protein